MLCFVVDMLILSFTAVTVTSTVLRKNASFEPEGSETFILVVPTPVAVISPLLETVATAGFSDDHVIVPYFTEVGVIVAVIVFFSPTSRASVVCESVRSAA